MLITLSYGTRSVQITRQYLDSGALHRYIDAHFCNSPSPANQEHDYRIEYLFIVLLACAMSLGKQI
jgi:hypothetical protein